MLRSVGVGNFKSLGDHARLALGGLTVLAGGNSSGKSSVLQPLLLLKQTLEASYDPGPLKLDGPNVTFSSSDQFLRRRGTGTSRSFSVSIEHGPGTGINLDFGFPKDRPPRVNEVKISDERLGADGLRITPRLVDSDLTEAQRSGLLARFGETRVKQLLVSRRRCFLDIDGVVSSPTEADRAREFIVPLTYDLYYQTESAIEGLLHLPGLRGNPERLYPRTAIEGRYPGQFQDYFASILHRWQEDADERLRDLGRSLERLGLTWKVHTRAVDETRVELQVGRLPHARQGGAWDLVNIADVGLGVSQLLPVLVALLEAQRGQAVYIEQPEIHLHPRAQYRLSQEFLRAAARGVQVIVETHSALFLRGIQARIAAGELDPDRIALFWFNRSEVTGDTGVTRGELDSRGRFSDLPLDFDEVRLEAETDYLQASLLPED